MIPGVIVIHEMTVQELEQKLASGAPILLVDVRQPDEHAFSALPQSLLIPMSELTQRWSEIDAEPGTEIVVYCHHGIRSRHAASYLAQCGVEAVSLKGGIDAWSRQIDPKVPRY
jgi:adenylyltransferase/sulfurtransferase